MIFFTQKSDNVCCFLRITHENFLNFLILKLWTKFFHKGMVWVLPGRKLGPWSEFLFSTDLQCFWILPVQILRGLSFGLSFLILWGWGAFWGQFAFFSPIWRGGGNFGWFPSFWGTFWGNLAGFLHFEGNFGWFSLSLGHILGKFWFFFFFSVGGNLAVFSPFGAGFPMILRAVWAVFSLI